jgi:hypothetical protein
MTTETMFHTAREQLPLVVTINAWHAIGVATRARVPGSYQP